MFTLDVSMQYTTEQDYSLVYLYLYLCSTLLSRPELVEDSMRGSSHSSLQ